MKPLKFQKSDRDATGASRTWQPPRLTRLSAGSAEIGPQVHFTDLATAS
jgi:hypothetical protein